MSLESPAQNWASKPRMSALLFDLEFLGQHGQHLANCSCAQVREEILEWFRLLKAHANPMTDYLKRLEDELQAAEERIAQLKAELMANDQANLAQADAVIQSLEARLSQAQKMVWAIHSVVHTLDQVRSTGEPRYLDSCLRELAEAAFAFDGDWLTKPDYGEKPRWMSQEMWDSLRDPEHDRDG